MWELAKHDRDVLIAYCKDSWLRSSASYDLSFDDLLEGQWSSWLKLETERRTGYAIWLLDCMWAIHTDQPPLVALADATVPLPCQEVLWEADSAVAWRQLYEVSTRKYFDIRQTLGF